MPWLARWSVEGRLGTVSLPNSKSGFSHPLIRSQVFPELMKPCWNTTFWAPLAKLWTSACGCVPSAAASAAVCGVYEEPPGGAWAVDASPRLVLSAAAFCIQPTLAYSVEEVICSCCMERVTVACCIVQAPLPF